MSVCSTAKRRRRQAKQKFNHLAPRQRPNYKQRSREAAAKHEARVRETTLRIQRNKGRKS